MDILEMEREKATDFWQQLTMLVAWRIRRRVLENVLKQGGGYLSQACSSAEIMATLYTQIMNLGPSVAPRVPRPFPGVPSKHNQGYFTGVGYNGPKGERLDRFIISPVHYALVLYATLVEVDRLAPESMDLFNVDGSSMEMIGAEHSPGHEVTAGSLGQGLSQAAGIAWARKRKGHSGRVWVFMSDGEFQLGQTWEALEIASHYGLDNLNVVVDVNGQSADGRMLDVLNIEPLERKLEDFGAEVRRVPGHDVDALAAAAEEAEGKRPRIILADTNPCYGIAMLEKRRPKLHYVRFNSDVERQEYEELLEQWNQGQWDDGSPIESARA